MIRENQQGFRKAKLGPVLGTDMELGFRQARGGILLTGFPDQPADPLCSVLKLKLSKEGI